MKELLSKGGYLADSRGRPLDCVILAAGSSTRMGRPKLGLPLGTGTLLGMTIANALAAGLRVIVVARRDDDSIRDLAGPHVEIVRNPQPGRGMISYLREGIGLVRAERFFFIPADMPFVGPEIYRELARYAPAAPVLPSFGGRSGHPVLLPSELIPAILALSEEVPLKSLIATAGPAYAEIGDDSILRDIDTVQDYEHALADRWLLGPPIYSPGAEA
jgi:molybdenum cofactor cytidylyltransferase